MGKNDRVAVKISFGKLSIVGMASVLFVGTLVTIRRALRSRDGNTVT